MADERRDPFAGYNFRLEIDGVEVAGFKEINGAETKTKVIEYSDGEGPNNGIIKRPGRTSYTNIIFKRGVSEGEELWEWYQEVIADARDFERKEIAIHLLDDDGEPQKTYTCTEAWPCGYKIASLSATDDQVAVEEIEFAFEALTIEA